jgi:hypothetical protein
MLREIALGMSAVVVAAGCMATPTSDGGPVVGHTQSALDTIQCIDEDTADSNATPYFNDTFNGSHFLSENVLNTYVPQGLTTWRNYYGPGHDLLVYTAHHEDGDDNRAVIAGIDQQDGSLTNYFRINDGHAGGIAIHDKWAFISGRNDTVRRYLLSNIRDRFSGQEAGALDGAEAGSVHAASFLANDGDVLFAGNFDADSRSRMYRYHIGDQGNLNQIGNDDDFVEVPKRTQGLLVLPDYFIFSTSSGRHDRSNIYVVKRGYKWLDNASLRCFRAPTLSEGVTISHDRVYVLFESGADYFANSSDKPDRIIKRLFWANREALPLIP